MPIVLDNDLTNNFSDLDGDLLTFQAETDNSNVTVAISGGSQLIISNLAANFTGTVNIIVSARDGRGGLISDALVLTVTPIDNDPPVNHVPGTQTILQNRPLYFGGANQISISDPDAGNNPVKTTLTTTNGTLTLGYIVPALTVSGNNTNNVVLTGTIADINTALNNLQYKPAQTFSGAATLTITTDDQGNSGPGTPQTTTDTVTISVIADSDFDGVPDTDDACPDTAPNASVNQYGCAAGQSANAPADLALWLTGDGDARDFSGNNADGSLNGGAGFAVGKVGQAFNFDGVDDSVNFNVPTSLTGNNPRTVEFWFNARANQVSANKELIYYGTYNSNQAFSIATDDAPISNTGSLRLKTTDSGNTFRFDTGIAPGNFVHLAATYDGATTLKVFVNGNLNQAFTLSAPLSTPGGTGNVGGFNNYFGGLIDEVSFYGRALSQAEIRAVVSVGTSGKLKSSPTATGTNVQTRITSASVSFPSVTIAGATSQKPLDGAALPMLPSGVDNNKALFIDVATSANYTGNPTVCFNIPAFSSTDMNNAVVYHLENGSWVNRTGTKSGAQICTANLTSLSPFAIAPTLAPTAAAVTISGKVITADGRGIQNVVVNLVDGSGNTRTARTSSFGYYRFTDVGAGETYVISAQAKRFTFAQPAQVLNVNDNLTEINFTANP